LLRGGGIGGPDVLVAEDEDAADDGLLLCLPEVVAVGGRLGSAPPFGAMALQDDVAGQGSELDEAGRPIVTDRLPGLQLAFVGLADVLDDERRRDQLRPGERVRDHLGTPVVVGVGVADEHLRQRLA
jgi:hypothetical protein